jgi:hypothetical protein
MGIDGSWRVHSQRLVYQESLVSFRSSLGPLGSFLGALFLPRNNPDGTDEEDHS